MEMKPSGTLVPELQRYVRDFSGFLMVKHPFVNGMLWNPDFHNEQLAEKRSAYDKAVREGKWVQAMLIVERPWRLDFVLEWRDGQLLDDETFRMLLMEAWIDAEFPHRAGKVRVTRAFKEAGFLSDAERTGPPDEPITVYRGGNKTGMSWSRSYKTALWFHERYGKYEGLWQAEIRPAGVLAMFDRRGEAEVVVNYRMLRNVRSVAA